MTRRDHGAGTEAATAPALDADGTPGAAATVVLRPRSAPVICVLVWALSAALLVDAVARAGVAGLRVLPFLLLAGIGAWALLWAPRVVLGERQVEVRNVLVTHVLPFASITAVRLGAMLRLDVRGAGPAERTITAWNAPGIGRDSPIAAERRRRAAPAGSREAAPRPLGRGERLALDQQRSRSAIVVQRWEAWQDAAERGNGNETPGPRPVTRVNTGVLVALAVGVLVVAVRVLL